jgi:hypothetical protein
MVISVKYKLVIHAKGITYEDTFPSMSEAYAFYKEFCTSREVVAYEISPMSNPNLNGKYICC